jgi:hypothetical protein
MSESIGKWIRIGGRRLPPHASTTRTVSGDGNGHTDGRQDTEAACAGESEGKVASPRSEIDAVLLGVSYPPHALEAASGSQEGATPLVFCWSHGRKEDL